MKFTQQNILDYKRSSYQLHKSFSTWEPYPTREYEPYKCFLMVFSGTSESSKREKGK